MKRIVLKAALALLGISVFLTLIFVTYLKIETNRESKRLVIETIEFHNLDDGTYVGKYDGYAGPLKLRAKELQVTVSLSRVTDIEILKNGQPYAVSEGSMDELINSIITLQSLDVDTITGATVTSKTYLRAVEDALLKAQKQQEKDKGIQ